MCHFSLTGGYRQAPTSEIFSDYVGHLVLTHITTWLAKDALEGHRPARPLDEKNYKNYIRIDVVALENFNGKLWIGILTEGNDYLFDGLFTGGKADEEVEAWRRSAHKLGSLRTFRTPLLIAAALDSSLRRVWCARALGSLLHQEFCSSSARSKEEEEEEEEDEEEKEEEDRRSFIWFVSDGHCNDRAVKVSPNLPTQPIEKLELRRSGTVSPSFAC
ncbi:unnamed protein product [Schistocephalus solidus]|uniref:Uncharacterized protein n=1 Tax=Schistocephalus solidus TaxID=70667 RepID=A0A183SD97_SCHSO|nr:unnamed protein product [Schistocephalus solidus]